MEDRRARMSNAQDRADARGRQGRAPRSFPSGRSVTSRVAWTPQCGTRRPALSAPCRVSAVVRIEAKGGEGSRSQVVRLGLTVWDAQARAGSLPAPCRVSVVMRRRAGREMGIGGQWVQNACKRISTAVGAALALATEVHPCKPPYSQVTRSRICSAWLARVCEPDRSDRALMAIEPVVVPCAIRMTQRGGLRVWRKSSKQCGSATNAPRGVRASQRRRCRGAPASCRRP